MKPRKYKRTHSKVQSNKTKFRRSAKWMRFRKLIKEEQKTDPVTGSKLSATANLHHMDLDEEHYEDISDRSHFVMLNRTTHDVLHFIYAAHGGWRQAISKLTELCERMEAING